MDNLTKTIDTAALDADAARDAADLLNGPDLRRAIMWMGHHSAAHRVAQVALNGVRRAHEDDKLTIGGLYYCGRMIAELATGAEAMRLTAAASMETAIDEMRLLTAKLGDHPFAPTSRADLNVVLANHNFETAARAENADPVDCLIHAAHVAYWLFVLASDDAHKLTPLDVAEGVGIVANLIPHMPDGTVILPGDVMDAMWTIYRMRARPGTPVNRDAERRAVNESQITTTA